MYSESGGGLVSPESVRSPASGAIGLMALVYSVLISMIFLIAVALSPTLSRLRAREFRKLPFVRIDERIYKGV